MRSSITGIHPWLKSPMVLVVLVSVIVAVASGRSPAQNCVSNMLLLGQNGDGVQVPSTPALELTGGLTLECWASASGQLTNSALIEKATTDGAASYALGLDSSGRPYFRVRSLSGEHSLVGPPLANPRVWHHYAAAFFPGDSLYLYVDGLEVGSLRFSETQLRPGADTLRIGLSVRQSTSTFVGAIDEVRIWSRARTLLEIRSTMNQVLTLPQTSLAAYFPFDDDPTLTSIFDFATQHIAGDLIGQSPAIVPGTSPITGTLPGYKIGSVESFIECHTIECSPTFDTMVHYFNRSDGPITLGSIGFSSGLAFSVTGPGNILIPKDSNGIQAVRIHFSPQHGGSYTDTLTALSSSICGGIIRIPVHANFRTIELTTDQRVVGFGIVPKCNQPLLRTVKLSNLGNEDAHITGATWVPTSDVDLISPTLPFTLHAGQDTTLVLQLRAGPDGPISSTLTLSAAECGQRANIAVAADRASINITIPPSIVLPSRQATLTSVITDTTIAIWNTGTIPFFLAPTTVLGTGYTILHSPSKTYLVPGDTAFMTIRFQTTTCGDFPGSVLLHTSNPCNFDTIIPLSIHVGPPLVTADTDHYFLGNTCTSFDTVLRFANTGDQPVLVKDIYLSSQNIFTLPANPFPDTIPAHAAITVPLHFAPLHAGRYTVNAQLILIPCGTVQFLITASAGLQGMTVSDTLLGFGRGCNFSNTTRSVVLTNHTQTPVTIASARISGSPNFTLQNFPVPFILGAQSSVSIDIIYRPNRLGQRDDGLLTLISDSGCLINTVHLEGSREIPIIRFAERTSQFDTICPGDSITKQISLFNFGIDTVDITSITIPGTSDFSVISAPGQIAAGDSGVFIVTFKPASIGPSTTTMTIGIGPCTNPISAMLIGSGGPLPSLQLLPTTADFGVLPIGDTATTCIKLTNPSCTPITLDPASLALPSNVAFTAAPSSLTLLRGDTATLCLRYTPTKWDTLSVTTTLRAATGESADLQLRGVGLGSELHVPDTVLDFGYVLVNDQQQLPLTVSNKGNLVATASISAPTDPTFSIQRSSLTAAPVAAASEPVSFLPPAIGRHSDTLIVSGSGLDQRVILRGEGVPFGLTQSLLELDFGSVHLGTGTTLPVHFMATNGFPITISKPTDRLPFTFSILPSSINPIRTDKDTFTLAVNFSPTSEVDYVDTISIINDSHPTQLVLRGRGIEAHPVVQPDTIDFGKVHLGSTLPQQLIVTDTGGYPLTVTAITSNNPAFTLTAFQPTEQASKEQRSFTANFTPITVKPTTAVLAVHTTAPDSIKQVVAIGRGTYGPTGGPDLRLSIANAEARVGDHLTIPVTLSIDPLASIQLDSLRLDIAFDAYSIYFSGVTSASTLTAASNITFTKTSDSTISVMIKKPGAFYPSGVLLLLNAEALLGPHDTSFITITGSNPENTLSPLAAEGQFVVTDCNGQPGNVTLTPAASAITISPNPAGDLASINYSLDHPTHVKLDCFDPLGKLVRVFIDETQPAGSHTINMHFDGIASGRYVYSLHLDDQLFRGGIVVTH